MNNSNKISSHKCHSNRGSCGTVEFCSVCGLHLPSRSKNLKLYRSSRFNVRDTLKLESSQLLTNMIKKQNDNRFFNTDSCHLEVRQSLIDFVTEIGLELAFKDLTIHSAIAMFDAVFSLYLIKKEQMKMIAYVSLHLSAKMHENNGKLPKLSQISQLFQNVYTLSDLEECERSIFKILNFKTNLITPFVFIEFFLSKGLISNKDRKSLGKKLSTAQFERKIHRFEDLVYHYINLSLAYYEFYQFSPIAIATAAILCARKDIGFKDYWPLHIQELTGVKLDSIVKCAETLFFISREELEQEEEEELESEMEEESPVKQFSISGNTYLEEESFSKRQSYDRISEFEFLEDEYEGFDVC